MKICPTCNQTYNDETLNFCLSDGSVLNAVNEDNMSSPTVFMGQAPVTSQNPTIVQQTSANPTIVQPNSSFQASNRGLSNTVPVRPPVKKSKAWIWIIGILGIFIVVGGLGFVILVALVASIDETTDSNSNVQTTPTPVVTFDSILKDDLSKWQTSSNNLGNTEFTNGEYIMSSKQPGYYYVLLTAAKNFKTSNASTKLIARNVTGKEARSGYGLVIHSDSKPLTKDYSFLIESTKQSYRVVQHTPGLETELVSWTRFPAIRSGTQTNEIEVKDQNGKMSFFINGQFAITVNDTVNYKDGIFGLYVSDAVPIAFSNLQIVK